MNWKSYLFESMVVNPKHWLCERNLCISRHFVCIQERKAHNGGISIRAKRFSDHSPGHIMFLDGPLQLRLA